jgi:L-histidine N-alpha-methyltransferase
MHAGLTRISERLEIITVPRREVEGAFARDVVNGLRAFPKTLPSKYFYDDLGSALFDAITYLPEYYLTQAELEILRESGWEIVRALEEPVEFLELGSGTAVKTRALIGEAIRAQGTLRYSPIDIAAETLKTVAEQLVEAFPTLTVRAYAADYFDVLEMANLSFDRRVLAMLMGSNLGNYDPPAQLALLRRLGDNLCSGDALLLGADSKKDRVTLELAYNDPTGVTAAFNKNLLGRINRELGGTFDLNAFDHVVEYDERRGSVDSFLQSRRAQRVEIAHLGIEVDFEPGERIHTESSHKFDLDTISALGKAAGFRLGRSWFDAKKRYGVHLLVRD